MQCKYTVEGSYVCSISKPSLWQYLHKASFNYPMNPSNDDKQQFIKLFNKFKSNLPQKWQDNLNKLPQLKLEDLNSKESLSRYTHKLHESINIMLGKKTNIMYEDAKQKYTNTIYERFYDVGENPEDLNDDLYEESDEDNN